MPVKEPHQNTHRWWGTLTRDAKTVLEGEDLTLPLNQECIFIKTNADTHFIPQDTVIKRLKILGTLSNIETILTSTDLPDRAKTQIRADLGKYPAATIVTEVLGIDWDESPPLAQELFDHTERLFHDNEWLTRHRDRVGKEDIELGRELLRLTQNAELS